MKKAIILTICLLITTSYLTAQSTEKLDLFFKLSDYFLKRHVYNGLVNYRYSTENSGEIELLHKTIGEVDLTNASALEKKAFWVNAYNLLVIYQITKSYPLARPLDKDGFFDKTSYSVAGEQLNLNELETRMLTTFDDPRFHFVLACGAMSCPKLYNLAFKPENVDKLMDERTKLALNDENFTRVNQSGSLVELSKIFEWYQKDFEKNGQSIVGFINTYRENKIPSGSQLSYYEYDWTLNER
ncbi:MAG: DUF547 domain-containing protein [Cyclobacteriaceae bacterium]